MEKTGQSACRLHIGVEHRVDGRKGERGEGGVEAAGMREGSLEASPRPQGFGFTAAESEVLLAPRGIHCTNSRGGCRGGGGFDMGSWSSASSAMVL